MSCRKWERMMVLELYGELDEARGRILRDHISKCASCARDHEEFLAIRQEAARALPQRPSEGRVASIRTYLGGAVARRRRRLPAGSPVLVFRTAMVTLGMAAIVVGLLIGFHGPRRELPGGPSIDSWLDDASTEIELLAQNVGSSLEAAEADWLAVEWEMDQLSESIRPT